MGSLCFLHINLVCLEVCLDIEKNHDKQYIIKSEFIIMRDFWIREYLLYSEVKGYAGYIYCMQRLNPVRPSGEESLPRDIIGSCVTKIKLRCMVY